MSKRPVLVTRRAVLHEGVLSHVHILSGFQYQNTAVPGLACLSPLYILTWFLETRRPLTKMTSLAVEIPFCSIDCIMLSSMLKSITLSWIRMPCPGPPMSRLPEMQRLWTPLCSRIRPAVGSAAIRYR